MLAASGDETALRRSADVCQEALLSRDGRTFDGWTERGAKRAQLLGCLQPSPTAPRRGGGQDGNPVAVRRRHPQSPDAAGPAASHSDHPQALLADRVGL
jgi:hypothetical protein